MKLVQGEKRIEIIIDSYEFPYDENGLYEDNNWLNVAVEWEDEVLCEQAVSPCLTTDELSSLCKGLSKALLDEPYESDFIEPDLTFCVKSCNGKISVQISYAKKGRERFYMNSEITKDELDEIVSDVHAMCLQFPQRKKKQYH